MSRKADFLKKVPLRANQVAVAWKQQPRNAQSKHKSRQKDTIIRKEHIQGFQFIGIFDRKVIVTYHNDLGLFGYFDFHAIHERIRYEYYSRKIKGNGVESTLIDCFDTQVIQKEGKTIRQPFGQQTSVLIKVSISHLALFGEGEKKTEVWGIQLQRNNHNEVYITSFKPILGKTFCATELKSILQQQIMLKGTKLPHLIDSWVAEYSCKSAYKFNDSLDRSRAVLLIKNLSKCEFPWFCVHGRNTVHTSSSQSVPH